MSPNDEFAAFRSWQEAVYVFAYTTITFCFLCWGIWPLTPAVKKKREGRQ